MRRLLLVTGALAVVAAMALQSLVVAALVLVAWFVLLSKVEPRALRRIVRPRLWAFTVALALLCGLLLGTRDTWVFGVMLSRSGLEAGAWMILRAMMLLSIAALVALSLSREGATEWIARAGFPGAGAAVRTAVETLPAVQDRLVAGFRRERKGAGRGLRARLRRLDAWIVALVADTARRAAGRPRIFAVTGPQGAGKTTGLRRLAETLESLDVPTRGFLQPAVFEAGRRVGYDLRVLGGETVPIARRSGSGGFSFADPAFELARTHLEGTPPPGTVTLVDEVGWMEAAGYGHWPAVDVCLGAAGPDAVFVLSVREGSLAAVRQRVGGYTRVLTPEALAGAMDGGDIRLVLF
jgi:nucleoside-triphosphatase THEP1